MHQRDLTSTAYDAPIVRRWLTPRTSPATTRRPNLTPLLKCAVGVLGVVLAIGLVVLSEGSPLLGFVFELLGWLGELGEPILAAREEKRRANC